ncbi:MAG: hypothetical protein PWQ12_1110 [Clostridiales bacterium]|jgi:ubiquinone/menaquinone biosynthesis C-methylase UbiE|nr:hypothetical protein [Clostridiales bacterium]
MNEYSSLFAMAYDHLQYDVDYALWVSQIADRLEKRFGRSASVLELACGTGTLAIGLSAKGFFLEGVDRSEDMLAEAQQKAFEAHKKIRFYQQDMRALETHRQYDAVVSVCDGLNYITEASDMAALVKSVYRHLNPGGLFIFEMSSEYKLEHIIGDSTFAEALEDTAYIWENQYDASSNLLTFDLTIFSEASDGRYVRHEESHKQRAYAPEQLLEFMRGYFDVEEILDSVTFEDFRPNSERLCMVARKSD